jgi:T4 RnlA family RNA ligase
MFTDNQKNLYNDLLALTANEAFYFIDQKVDDVDYRIFNYRLASYTDFCATNALECRGIMFEMVNGQPVRLAARTPEKFFNYRENPFTMEVDFSKTTVIMDKADGSLISTYLHKGEVRLKTKASLFSEQAQAAMKVLEADDQLSYAVKHFVNRNYTVNMEYVAPDNRIVLWYDKPKLIVLSIRHNDTGEYVSAENLRDVARAEMNNLILRYWVKTFKVSEIVEKYGSVQAFVDQIDTHESVEGFVVNADGRFLKLKTAWYLTRHRAKDSINSTRRLFEAVLEEAVDDVRALFFDDPVAIARIDEVQKKTDTIYNHLVATIEKFYATNKELDRKGYAILGQQTLTDGTFGLAMSKYLGKEVDYKEYLKKNYKKYGFTDDVQNEE